MSEGNDRMPPEGLVLEIQRMSTEDGPGLRTTVFFKGCSLQCSWCHNPESISSSQEVQWIGSKCIGCGTCRDICPNDAISLLPEGISIDRELCEGCGACADECPSTAMELIGEQWSVNDLIDEVIKDLAYFEKSGGGVTVSGGDPTMQPHFVSEFLKSLKKKGVHTALDTCGQCNRSALEMLLPHADLVLFDIKEIDLGRHRTFTGRANDKIFENLRYIRDHLRDKATETTLWIRTPIIPNATATRENIAGIGAFIADELPGMVERWELCSFNNLCKDKYTRLGRKWPFSDSDLLDAAFLERLHKAAKESGISSDIVHLSGEVKGEESSESNLRLVVNKP